MRLFLFFIIISNPIFSQINLLDLSEKKKDKSSFSKQLTEKEVKEALIKALQISVENSVQQASSEHGFFNNKLIKLPFPEDAQQMKKTLIKIGMSKQIDEFEYKINYAAEIASKEALPIFFNSIKEMNIDDVFSVLNGEDNAITNYLERTSYTELYKSFYPIVQNIVVSLALTKHWGRLAQKYNSIPLTKKVDTDLENYITEKAIKGLFLLIAEKEMEIRSNPFSTKSNLLIKVFN